MNQVIELNCPGCGARVSTGQTECEWCHKPIVISTFNSVYSMTAPEVNKYAGAYKKALAENPDNDMLNSSAGMCYLKLGLYDKALAAFEKAIADDFDNADTYFFAAVSVLKGKKAFLTPRADIDKALSYIDAALMIETKGIYYYFQAYIKYDYFKRKFLNVSPDYNECLTLAQQCGVSQYDKEVLFSALKVDCPFN